MKDEETAAIGRITQAPGPRLSTTPAAADEGPGATNTFAGVPSFAAVFVRRQAHQKQEAKNGYRWQRKLGTGFGTGLSGPNWI